MTWFELLMEKGYSGSYMGGSCPGFVFSGNKPPFIDDDSAVFIRHNAVGCRGITCPECWNQEASNDLD
jgi:hypothetical protein